MVLALCSHCENEEEMRDVKEGRTPGGKRMRHGFCTICGTEMMLVEKDE